MHFRKFVFLVIKLWDHVGQLDYHPSDDFKVPLLSLEDLEDQLRFSSLN